MSFQETSGPAYRGNRAATWTRQMEARAHYRLVMAAMLPAFAILLAATVMMTKLLMV